MPIISPGYFASTRVHHFRALSKYLIEPNCTSWKVRVHQDEEFRDLSTDMQESFLKSGVYRREGSGDHFSSSRLQRLWLSRPVAFPKFATSIGMCSSLRTLALENAGGELHGENFPALRTLEVYQCTVNLLDHFRQLLSLVIMESSLGGCFNDLKADRLQEISIHRVTTELTSLMRLDAFPDLRAFNFSRLCPDESGDCIYRTLWSVTCRQPSAPMLVIKVNAMILGLEDEPCEFEGPNWVIIQNCIFDNAKLPRYEP